MRLHRVQIENKPYQQIIERIDKPNTLFYIDPPYWDCENVYGKGIFNKDDFTKLAKQLAGIKGKFVLSLNDTQGVRDTFAAFRFEEVRTRYSLNKDANKEVGELLITNFEPEQ